MASTFTKTKSNSHHNLTYCSEMNFRSSQRQYSEDLTAQLRFVEADNVGATIIGHCLDMDYHGIQAILLAPAIYASADLPVPAGD